jgi:hypothetical protein
MTTIEASIIANRNALMRSWFAYYPEVLGKQKQLRQEADAYHKIGVVFNSTKSVNGKKLKRCLKKFDAISEEAIKLTIVPIGFQQRCHQNCDLYCAIDKDFEPKLGYNITACPCGNCMTMELHSVLYHKPTNKFYDITEDYEYETEKWFMPFKTKKTQLEFRQLAGRDFDFGSLRYAKCGCPNNNYRKNFDPPDLIEYLEHIDKLVFINKDEVKEEDKEE